MALIDIMLVFTLALMTASLRVPESIMGRLQGIATVITSCLFGYTSRLLDPGQSVLSVDLGLAGTPS